MLQVAMQPGHLHNQVHNPAHSHRWKMTPENKLRLQQAFDEVPYPSREVKTALANELGVRREQVAKWFQHRRETLSKLGQFQGQAMRARRTEGERRVLQDAYDRNPYPNQGELAQLSQMLQNVTEKQIKLWFKHKRKQMKKKGQLTPRRRSTRLSTDLPQVVQVPPPQQQVEPIQEYPGFSPTDQISLRAALLAAGNMEPPLACMESLAQMLNRPLPMIQQWFMNIRESPCQQGQDVSNIFGGRPLSAKVVEDDSASQNAQLNPAKRRKTGVKSDPGPVYQGHPQQQQQQPCMASFPQYCLPPPNSRQTSGPPGLGLQPHLKFQNINVDVQQTQLPSSRDFPQFMMVGAPATTTEQQAYMDPNSAAQQVVDPGMMVDPNSYNRQAVSAGYTFQPKSWFVSPSQPQGSLPDPSGNMNPGWPSTA